MQQITIHLAAFHSGVPVPSSWSGASWLTVLAPYRPLHITLSFLYVALKLHCSTRRLAAGGERSHSPGPSRMPPLSPPRDDDDDELKHQRYKQTIWGGNDDDVLQGKMSLFINVVWWIWRDQFDYTSFSSLLVFWSVHSVRGAIEGSSSRVTFCHAAFVVTCHLSYNTGWR